VLKEANVDTSAGFSTTVAPLEGDSTAGSNVILVGATSTNPQLAADAANAYAQAWVDMNRDAQMARVSKSTTIVQEQLAKYQGDAKLTGEYLMLKQRLQDLRLLQATATGDYRVLTPASVPASPYAPNLMRSILLGFGIGLFAGIGLAFLVELFDTRLRRPEDVVAVLQQPVLGRIPRISKQLLGESAVVALTHPEGSAAEAFRLLRTNLEFVRVIHGFKSLLVTSSVQGEGKSVCVANFAITLAAGGKKVVIVDADLRRPRQHSYFGLENEKGVSTVATGQTPLEDALQKVNLADPAAGASDIDFQAWARGSGALSRIYVLTSGPFPPNPGEIVSLKRFGAMLDALTSEADVVIIDSPAMLAVGDTPAMAPMVDGLLFLVDMNTAKRPMMQQAAEQLRRLPCPVLGLALRVDDTRHGHYYYSSYSKYGYYASPDGSGKKRSRHAKGTAKA
jgi:Mrp family chromosome partitioning ATPase